MLAKNGFPFAEFKVRIEKVVNYLNETGADAYLISDPYNVFYLGLYYYPGKRPLFFFIHKSGKVYAFVPSMEYHAATKLTYLDRLLPCADNYSENENMFTFMRKVIKTDFPDVKTAYVDDISVDKLSAVESIFDKVVIHNQIAIQRQIKSPLEVEMLRASARYADYMVTACRKYMKPDFPELSILNRGVTDTVDLMIADGIEVVHVPGGPALALIPSGVNTAKPHALPSQRAVRAGENMILSCGANVWGYRTECERAVFLGEPDKELLEMFEVMRQAQEMGIKLMRPGALCCEVEQKVVDFITGAGYAKCIRHRTGHGKGLEEHEAPYIAAGDETVLQAGMIFSSEPGLYMDGMAGVRHSDTVLVTENGGEALTKYPKSLAEMIVPL